MGAAQQSLSRANANQVIVHHLSDLNYQENTNSTNNKFLTYQRYLEGFPEDLFPDVVVITGNLTAQGTEQELRAVRDMLVAGFSRWDGRLHEHIFIVPGPQDITWRWDPPERNRASLATFYEIFKLFWTPAHAQTSSGQTSPVIETDDWIGYLIDTCYSPDELDTTLKKHFKTYAKDFGKFMKRRRRVGSRVSGIWRLRKGIKKDARDKARKQELDELQKGFLIFTESTRPLDLRVGRVTTADVNEFSQWDKRWTKDFAQKVQAAIAQAALSSGASAHASGGVPRPPLKILITHHPIIIRANDKLAPTDPVVSLRSFTPLFQAVRGAGFTLALHGHHHNEDVVAEQSVLQEPIKAKQMWQFGAASLAQTGVFNEITAVYRETPGQLQGSAQPAGEWDITCLTRDLSAAGPVAPRGTPGNQTTIADKNNKRLTREKEQFRRFEETLRFSMRRFGEQVWDVRKEKLQGGAQRITMLPQESLFLIRDVISGVVFKGYETHVRLLLKTIQPGSGAVPRLVPTYLTPAMMEGADTLIYPASIAAWSLILGRKLIYSEIDRTDIQPKSTDADDHEWLRQSGKIEGLVQVLKALEAEATNTNATTEADRFRKLQTNLLDIKAGPTSAPNARIEGETMFRTLAKQSPLRGWPTFICLPYPLRPIGGAKPTLPEIAVLEVGVRPMEPPDPEDTTPMRAGLFKPFSDERVEMLEVVTDLIGMMLTTADALGRPPGSWS